MSVAPEGAVKLLRAYSDDKSTKEQFPDAWLQRSGIGGLVIRLGSGRQIHGSGDLGHIRPGDYNDHSAKAHMAQAKRLGMFAILEFELHLGGDDHFAGDDYMTEDNQFVPFKHQLSSAVPGQDYHAFWLTLVDHGNTGGNVAQKLSHFLRMLDDWMIEYGTGVPVYLRLHEELWSRGSGEVASIIVSRYDTPMPYALQDHTRSFGGVDWDNPPEPFEAAVYEPGPAQHKWNHLCAWRYGRTAYADMNMEWFVLWGNMARAIHFLGKPVNYGEEPGGGTNEPPGGGGGTNEPPTGGGTTYDFTGLINAINANTEENRQMRLFLMDLFNRGQE